MNISIIAVGKVKEKYIKEGIAEFEKRLTPFAKVTIKELTDEKTPEVLSEAEEGQVKKIEGARILKKIPVSTHVIALAIDGQMLSSEQLADKFDKLATYGKSKVAIVIGGSLGLSDEVLSRADEKISFSKMTFPHQLMRLILLEQVYRSFKIIHGQPYHK